MSKDTGNSEKTVGGSLYRPSSEARVTFLRSLAVMLRAGIPIDRCLRLLGEQIDDPVMSMVSRGMCDAVIAGHTLSSAMNRFPGAFTKMQSRLIKVGESTGNLEHVLGELSRYEEKHRALVMKVKGALSYPAFIFVIAFVMLVLVPPYMMDGLFKMVEGAGVEPPLITKIVMAFTAMTRSWWFYTVLVGLIGTGAYYLPRWLNDPEKRYKLYDYGMAVPMLGKVIVIIATARFCRALDVQLSVGISPLHAIRLAAQASGNPVLEKNIEIAVDAMHDGELMEEALARLGFFPPLVTQMVRAGEETGTVSDMLNRLGAMYEVELDSILETFTSLLEPMVMLSMGVVVGILVLSTMLPLMQVLQNL